MTMKVASDEFVGVDKMNEDELRTLARELLDESSRLHVLVHDMLEAIDRYGSHFDAKYIDGSCDLCRKEYGSRTPCDEDNSEEYCAFFQTEYFRNRMRLIGMGSD